MPVIIVPSPFRGKTGGEPRVTVQGNTVDEAINSLIAIHPEMKVLKKEEKLNRSVNIYIGNQDIRHLNNLETPVGADQELVLSTAIAGG